MPLTATQLQLRRKHLTASEMPAVVGANPYESPADVFFAKHDEIRLTELDSEAARIGSYAEAGILQFAEDELGVPLTRANSFRVSHADPLFSATHDAMVVGRREGVEAKLTSMVDQWADGPPEYVKVQCQMQMFVSDLTRVWVPVMMVGYKKRLVLHQVERDDEMIEELCGIGHAFWDRYVEPGVLPLEFAPSMDTLRRIVREPNKAVPLDPELVQTWEDAKELRKAHDAWSENREDASLLAAIGVLADQFSKERTTPKSIGKTRREELELVCFEYVTG